uniref:Succinate dehydrogenase assembly factor 4, mitochondrial n=1 Tax=Catagonus wagneri TaxID=51154 RepID=A0A8C3W169_9CETA
MAAPGLALLLGHLPVTAWRTARRTPRKMSSQGEKYEQIKQPLKKPKLPEGRFDAPEDFNLEKKPLTKFPDDVNPLTKEKNNLSSHSNLNCVKVHF